MIKMTIVDVDGKSHEIYKNSIDEMIAYLNELKEHQTKKEEVE